MARIRPFAGWRFSRTDEDLTPVVSPPYDVISPEQRLELLSRDTHNTVALELPDGPLDPQVPGNRYETGKRTWDEWRAEGLLTEDDQPAIYVLDQHYILGGKEIHRRAFIVEVALEPFDAGVILPHERTLPKALGDRFELIKATGANFSQVFGLFDDAQCETDATFESIMSDEPVARAVDDDGVRSTLWATNDAGLARKLSVFFEDKQIFIADGHHRYTTALAYRDLRRAAETAGDRQDPAYDQVMMALVNMDDDNLIVLPTHRVANAPDLNPEAFKESLLEHFVIEDLEAADLHSAFDGVDEPAMLVQTSADGRPFRIRLRPDIDLDAAIPLERSRSWKSLDVAVLQELILNPLLDIHPDRPETLERLRFFKDAHAAMSAVSKHDVAFLLRSTRMEQLRDVALAGETMPQKSTYFYPKLISGMVFRSAE